MTPVNSSEDRANKSKALSEGEGQLKQAHTKLKEVKRQLRSIKRVTRRDVLRQLRNFRTKRRKSDSALKA